MRRDAGRQGPTGSENQLLASGDCDKLSVPRLPLCSQIASYCRSVTICREPCWAGSRFTNNLSILSSTSMQNSFHYYPCPNEVLATKFCTWHDSCVVVACAKYCNDQMYRNGTTTKQIVYQIWIMKQKSPVRWDPCTSCTACCYAQYTSTRSMVAKRTQAEIQIIRPLQGTLSITWLYVHFCSA